MATKTRCRLAAIAALAASIAIAAAVVTQTSSGSSKKVVIGNGSVSVLARAARASDALPSRILALPFAEKNFASAAGAGSRLIRTDGSLQLYAVPGKGRLLCLIEIDAAAQSSGGACADRRSLLTGSIYMADQREDGSESWDVVGLVGDGHTFAEADGRKVAVQNNSFILRGVRGGEVILGSSTATQTVEIGG